MNSLEFIEEEIKNKKNVLDEELDENELFILSLIEEDYLGRLNDELQQLEQIKTILEAWEVVKRYKKELSVNGIIFEHIINVSHTKQDYEKVKKALEVEDE